jgi:hypothetical protein
MLNRLSESGRRVEREYRKKEGGRLEVQHGAPDFSVPCLNMRAILLSRPCQAINFKWHGQHINGHSFRTVSQQMVDNKIGVVYFPFSHDNPVAAEYSEEHNMLAIDVEADFTAAVWQLNICSRVDPRHTGY